MAQNVLKPGTGGYTVFPNWALDALAKCGSNALALGALLLRLIPGQTGDITLQGNTSRRSLCAMLQWGTENSAKFDLALAAIERAGLITVRIEQGNTKIISVNGSLDSAALRTEGTPTEIAPPVIALALPAKIASAAAVSTRTGSIKNKTNINNLTLHRTPERVAIQTGNDDENWGELFSLYSELFKQPVPDSQRRRFVGNAQQSRTEISELTGRLRHLAEHPLLSIEVTSINALWHYSHLLKTASTFDKTVASTLEELARRDLSADEFLSQINNLVQNSHGGRMSKEAFHKYFSGLIASLQPSERAEDPAPQSQWLEATETPILVEVEQVEEDTYLDSNDHELTEAVTLVVAPSAELSDVQEAEDIGDIEPTPPNKDLALHAPELLQAQTKTDLQCRLTELLATDLSDYDRQTMVTLMEFAQLEKTTLAILHSMIKMRQRRLAA